MEANIVSALRRKGYNTAYAILKFLVPDALPCPLQRRQQAQARRVLQDPDYSPEGEDKQLLTQMLRSQVLKLMNEVIVERVSVPFPCGSAIGFALVTVGDASTTSTPAQRGCLADHGFSLMRWCRCTPCRAKRHLQMTLLALATPRCAGGRMAE